MGYDGKQVVTENLRQLCVFKVTNDSGKPWKWWDFVTDFQIRCPMKEKKYGPECAEEVIKSLCNILWPAPFWFRVERNIVMVVVGLLQRCVVVCFVCCGL